MAPNDPNNALLQRLDLAIQKLTDVSNEIKQVLVVHETKLDQQEELNRQYYAQIDTLHKRLGSLRDEIMKKIDDIEKWRWILMGGAIVVGMLAGNMGIEKLFG